MNEAGLNAKWLQKDLTHKETQDFAEDVLNFMREKLSDYQELYGDLYNLEATPAESTTYRLAKHDKARYPDIITASEDGDTPYYTNSSHLPVGYTESVSKALEIQDRLQVLYTSGTVFHAFLGQKLQSWQAAANVVRKIAENFKLPYFTLSPTYSICPEHGYLNGEKATCHICGAETEVYSRITGYYRPLKNWNDGKQKEFKDRKEYVINTTDIIENAIREAKQNIKSNSCGSKEDAHLMLFTTENCPNCKMIKQLLEKENIKYEIVAADIEVDLSNKYQIKQVPTLVVQAQDSVEKYNNFSNIVKYING
jgi:ribonucleoside-triphosphate reductase